MKLYYIRIIGFSEYPEFGKASHTVCPIHFRKMKMNKCKTIQWREASTIGKEMFY